MTILPTYLPTYLPRVQALPSKKNRHLGYVSLWETRSGGAEREGQENRKVKKIQNWKKRVRDSERSFKMSQDPASHPRSLKKNRGGPYLWDVYLWDEYLACVWYAYDL